MSVLMISAAVMLVAVRLITLRGFWRLPLRHGEERFLGQRVGPQFYREAGAPLLRRYHVSLAVALVLDAPLSLWLAFTQRYAFLFFDEFIAILVTIVAYNVIVVHFSYRALAMGGLAEEPPAATTLQLSMAPRRLRDHTNRVVEPVILAALLSTLLMLAHGYALSAEAAGGHAAQRVVLLYPSPSFESGRRPELGPPG